MTTTPARKPFDGFHAPEENYSRLPHQFIALMKDIDTLAEMKVIIYLLRHTWGFKNFDGKPKRITLDEFVHGVKKSATERFDEGCGLQLNAVRQGLKRAKEHGYIIHEQNATDKARIQNAYMLNMSSVIESDLVDHPESSNAIPRVIQQITQSDPTNHSGYRTGSPDLYKESVQRKESKESEKEKSVESRVRLRVHARDIKSTHTQHTANLRALKRMAKTNVLINALALEESPDMAATAPESLDQPAAPLSPVPPPPLPTTHTGTRVPLSAEDEDRLATGKARICAGACERLLDIEMFRKDGSSHLYRECRDCGKWHPQSPYQLSMKRQREERQNPHPRSVVHTFGAAGAQSKAQTDMTHVAAHPLWLAFRDEWKTLSGGQIELGIDKPTRYRQTVDALDAKGATADEVRGIAREKWAAGKGDYAFNWLDGDIDRYRGKQLAAKSSATSGGAGQGNSESGYLVNGKRVANLLDGYDIDTIDGCEAALLDNRLQPRDRMVVEARLKELRASSRVDKSLFMQQIAAIKAAQIGKAQSEEVSE